MVAKTQRFEVMQHLMQIQNDAFWEHLEVLVKKAQKAEIAASNYFKPLTKEEYLAEIRVAREEARAGHVTSIEDVIKESENW